MNTPPIEIYWIGLIGIVATLLIALVRPGWRIGFQLARNSYVLVSCVVALVTCGMPRMGIRADDGVGIRTGEATNDNSSVRISSVHIENPRAATPRPPVPTMAIDEGSGPTSSVASRASETYQHPDPRRAKPRPPAPELAPNSHAEVRNVPPQLANGQGLELTRLPDVWADPRQAAPNPPIPTSDHGLQDTPHEIAAGIGQAVDPPTALPRPSTPSTTFVDASDAPTSRFEIVSPSEIVAPAEVVDVEAEAAAVDDVASETGADGRKEFAANDDTASDSPVPQIAIAQEPVGEQREPQLDVAAIIPSHSPGPVSLAHGDGYRVVAGPYYREGGGQRELDDELDRAVTTFIDGHIGRNGVADRLGFNAHFARQNLLIGQPEEEVKHETYPATRYMTAVLKFNQEFKDELDSRWTTVVREARLRQVSWGSGGVLALLAAVFGYLRLDTATHGFYTGRLRLATAGTILALAALGVFLARWIPWI